MFLLGFFQEKMPFLEGFLKMASFPCFLVEKSKKMFLRKIQKRSPHLLATHTRTPSLANVPHPRQFHRQRHLRPGLQGLDRKWSSFSPPEKSKKMFFRKIQKRSPHL
jgi:hypothetical protein